MVAERMKWRRFEKPTHKQKVIDVPLGRLREFQDDVDVDKGMSEDTRKQLAKIQLRRAPPSGV